MAFAGYLIKAGGTGGVEIPLEYMRISSYSAEVQRTESQNNRAITGLLHRQTAERTHVEISFETKPLKNKDLAALNMLLRSAMSDLRQRNITLEYYEPETDSYRTANCFMQDVPFPIRQVTGPTELIFEPVKFAFTEY